MDKLSKIDIKKSISKTVIDIFDTMLSLEVEMVDAVTDPDLDKTRVIGSVNFSGEVVGVSSIHVSKEFSRLLTASMLGIKIDEIKDEEEIKDVIGEISNMVTGNLKSDFLNAGLNCIISTPSITYGDNFIVDPPSLTTPQKFIFKYQHFDFLIELYIKEESLPEGKKLESTDLSNDLIQEKINSVDIGVTIINSVIDVFYTMLSMEIERTEEIPASVMETTRTVASVTFAGDVDGIFNIQVNDDFARIMTMAMLDIEENEIESDEEVYDVLREMSNMIGGNLKSQFVDAGLMCELSTPSITNGLDFKIESLKVTSPESFVFRYKGHAIVVEAGVKKDEKKEPSQEEIKAEEKTSIKPKAPQNELQNLDILLNIPLDITVELGRTQKSISELLKLGPASVVEFSQIEGEPVNILVNKTLIARGEVVVEKEKYGIRILEIISRQDRINSLQ